MFRALSCVVLQRHPLRGYPSPRRVRPCRGCFGCDNCYSRTLSAPPQFTGDTADEVALLLLFLLSDESGYITGAEVAIDGGGTL